MVVYYVDVLFGVNALMDGMVLCLTAFSCRRKVPKKRLVLVSCYGALWGLAPVLLPGIGIGGRCLLALGGIGSAVWMLFLPKSRREWLRLTAMTGFVCCFLGGAAGWVQQNTNWLLGMQWAAEQMTLLPLLASGCCSYGLFRLLSCFFTACLPQGTYQTTLRLWLGEDSTVVEAFLDTGNFLQRDAKSRPILIVSFRAMAPLLPLWVQQMFLAKEEPRQIVCALQAAGWEAFLLSYSALGKKDGVLPALVLKKGECLANGKVLAPLVAAIHDASLGQAGEAVLHPCLLTE